MNEVAFTNCKDYEFDFSDKPGFFKAEDEKKINLLEGVKLSVPEDWKVKFNKVLHAECHHYELVGKTNEFLDQRLENPIKLGSSWTETIDSDDDVYEFTVQDLTGANPLGVKVMQKWGEVDLGFRVDLGASKGSKTYTSFANVGVSDGFIF
jgi:hypothetical protein